ncbi:MAG: carboxypeptidase regulatory-like domain-containing protein [Planctomycetes bacterium]|nr:carboxypeptidase regulatory-like domain-containing protein [Planctomycetota bacterium]
MFARAVTLLGAWLAALCGGAAVLAQQEDEPPPPPPPPPPWRIKIVGEPDGLPRPGVLLHLATGPSTPATVDADGFLTMEPPQVRRLRSATTFRSGPDGVVELPAGTEAEVWRVFAGEPYWFTRAPERVGDEQVWAVGEREPVGVRVLDAARRPVAGLGVALQSGGRELSWAQTDAQGRAMLGVPKDHTARLHLAPAGWIGPLDGLPTIAAARSGRRGGDLVLPPFGVLRFRAIRGGQPARVRLGSYALRFPDEPTWLAMGAANAEPEGFGLLFPCVATGVRLVGHVDLGSHLAVDCHGPEVPGGVRTVDCEVPWRPVLHATSSGPAVRHSVPRSVQVTFVTDAGVHESVAGLRADGVVDFGTTPLRGRRLLAVAIDAPAESAERPEAWSVWRACDHDLSQAVIEIGALPMARIEQLRGRVVDSAGKPVAHAIVWVQPQPDGAQSALTADTAGRFVWPGAVLRARDGAPLAIRAQARRDGRRSEASVFAGGHALTLTLVDPVESATRRPARVARGTVTLTLAPSSRAAELAANMALVATTGFVRSRPEVIVQDDGVRRLTFDRLEAGRYALRAMDNQGQVVFLMHRLEVPAEGACGDPRLLGFRSNDAPVVRHVQVVDAQRVPIAGARVSGVGFMVATDGNGRVQLSTYDAAPLPGRVEVRGLRPLEVEDLADGLAVQPPPASQVRVVIAGLPAGVALDRIGVWVRHEQRERFEGPRAALGADGTVAVATPVAGNYLLSLLIVPPGQKVDDASRWRAIGMRADPIAIGNDPPAEIRWELDAATIEQVLQALAEK